VKAGRDADHPREDRNVARQEHFFVSATPPETDARAARAALEQLLATDAPALGAALPATFLPQAERYVALLLEANRRMNLTRVTEPRDVARLHLLDALAALPLLDAAAPSLALDLGSGGGVPGLVLALARPDLRWLLVDSLRKKADALRAFVAALELPNVECLAERAEILGRDPAHREGSDLVTARACAALPILLEYALPLLRVGGRLIAWKGPIGEDELAAGTRAASNLGGGEPSLVPTGIGALGEHRFVVVGKERATPARYPRRPGEPARRPLT
jgi:16S rRNA (guanine527-N7)-methyltransferase